MSWYWCNIHYGYMAVNTKIFKIPTLNFAFLGLGRLDISRKTHPSIYAQSPQIKGEFFLGWVAHIVSG